MLNYTDWAVGEFIKKFSKRKNFGETVFVITADHDKAAQLTPGSKIQFKEVNLDEAESLFKTYSKDIKSCLEKIK